jgi:hypothetical protein
MDNCNETTNKGKRMKHNNCYVYPKTVREAIDGERHYVAGKEKLPSVTTILSATQSADKADSLQAWRDRIGDEAANKIMKKLQLVVLQCTKFWSVI